jgi:hypothetical protein
MSAAPARSQCPVIRVDIVQGIIKEKLRDHVVQLECDVCNRIDTTYDSATEFSLPTREELGELAHNRKCRLRTCLRAMVREDC